MTRIRRSPGRLIVGIDGSEGAKAALRWAVDRAVIEQRPVEAVTAWVDEYALIAASPTGYAGQPGATSVELAERLAAEARELARRAVLSVDAQRADVPVRALARRGPPAAVLMEWATEADLIVVGEGSHGAVLGALLGSVVFQLVTHAPCPVVVVRGRAAA